MAPAYSLLPVAILRSLMWLGFLLHFADPCFALGEQLLGRVEIMELQLSAKLNEQQQRSDPGAFEHLTSASEQATERKVAGSEEARSPVGARLAAGRGLPASSPHVSVAEVPHSASFGKTKEPGPPPTPGPWKGTLKKDIRRSEMGLVRLNEAGQGCAGSPASCPAFAGCPGTKSELEFCESPVYDLFSPVPANGSCLDSAAEVGGVPSVRTTEEAESRGPVGCAEKTEHRVVEDRALLRSFRLRNVYVTPKGVTFNDSTVFDRSGCVRDDENLNYNTSSNEEVTHVNRAVGLFYAHGIAFFHTLIELIPIFLAVSPFLREDPSLPIFMKHSQFQFYAVLGAPIVGIPDKDLNVVSIEGKGLLHAKELIQPQFPGCGWGSKEILFHLRSRFYLPPDGLPFFDPGWRIRGQRALSEEEMSRVPEDWVVVLGRRPGMERRMEGAEEIESELKMLFGEKRVTVFSGSLHILEARKLFRRAALYVAAHGAAMSNMVFMPTSTYILELRPRDYPNACYFHLAAACSLNFHLVLGGGSKHTPLILNVTEVKLQLHSIAEEMKLRIQLP